MIELTHTVKPAKTTYRELLAMIEDDLPMFDERRMDLPVALAVVDDSGAVHVGELAAGVSRGALAVESGTFSDPTQIFPVRVCTACDSSNRASVFTSAPRPVSPPPPSWDDDVTEVDAVVASPAEDRRSRDDDEPTLVLTPSRAQRTRGGVR